MRTRRIETGRRRPAAAAGLLALLLVGGCAAPPETTAPEPSAAQRTRHLLPGTDNGLQVRQWIVDTAEADVLAVLDAHARPTTLDPETEARLARNGLRVVRVDAERLDAIRDTLGAEGSELDAWHGQALTWHEVAARPVGDDAGVVAVDGHVRRVEGGSVRLLARGWTTPMEVGPRFTLELAPVYQRATPGRLQKLIGRDVIEREVLFTIDEMLEAGSAYALVYESPSEDDEADAGTGPEIDGPSTIGEILLVRHAMVGVDEERITHTVLAFVPWIPDDVFPPGSRAE